MAFQVGDRVRRRADLVLPHSVWYGHPEAVIRRIDPFGDLGFDAPHGGGWTPDGFIVVETFYTDDDLAMALELADLVSHEPRWWEQTFDGGYTIDSWLRTCVIEALRERGGR